MSKTVQNQIRAASSELERQLTFFDQQLYSQFRLYAAPEIPETPFNLEGYHVDSVGINGAYTKGDSILQSQVLLAQIRHQMGARWPLMAASEIATRLGKIRKPGDPKKTLADQLSSIMQSYGDVGKIEVNAPDKPEPGLIERLKQKAINIAFAKFNELIRDALPFHDFMSNTDTTPDFRNGSTIVQITRSIESLLAVDSTAVTDHLLAATYLSNFGKTRVTTREVKGKMQPIITFGGTELGKIANRDSEQERVITGIKDYTKAKARVESYIYYIRLILSFIAKHMDSTTMTRINLEAVGLTTAIAAATFGFVVIPPAALRYIILICESIGTAKKELKQLLDGKSVSFLANYKSDATKLWYGDYLFIFLLVTPTEIMVERFASILTEVFPNAVSSSYLLTLNQKGKTYKLKRGYVAWQNND